jgi:GTP-binding protein
MSQNATFVGSYNDVRRIPSENLPQIAFAGRSNVGKSTLLNKLVGRKKLAKTSKTPGRTQMLNFFRIDDKYFFVDLPGYGYAKAPPQVKKQWGILVDEYLEKSANLKGLIFLLDCRRDPNKDDLMLLEWVINRQLDYVIVLTKADKLNKNGQNKKMAEIRTAFKIEPILFSGRTGLGKHELWRWIEKITG